MAGKFPTALHVAETLKDEIGNRLFNTRSWSAWPVGKLGAIKQHGWKKDRLGPAMDIRAFDMTLADGRVYRVRVSDITPESGG